MFYNEKSNQRFSENNMPIILFSVTETSRYMLRTTNPFDLF